MELMSIFPPHLKLLKRENGMEPINWEAVQAVSETLGLLIVVGSLIYVGTEVRQNAKATRAATMNNMMNAWGDAYRGFSESENIGRLVWTGAQDPNELSGAERWRFSIQIAALFHNFQNAHYQQKLGVYDEEVWAAQSHYLTNLMSLPGIRATWDERKQMFSKDFRDFVETHTLKTLPDDSYRLAGT
jgi:hypothetical protein